MEPELIADYACETGEGPLWHPMERRLYWVDIPQGRMFRYDPATRQHEQCYQGDVVGGYTIQEDGALLLFMAHGVIKTWRDGVLTTVKEGIPGDQDTRFNDVIADPAGRVFCGTMAIPGRDGRLYRLDHDGTLTTVIENVGVSNGMGFTPDLKHMYYTDTRAREISLFDYDQQTGEITNRRPFARVADGGEGAPDGMTVDAEGYVWSARWGGSRLVRYAPDGRIDQEVFFPALKVSSASFGGDDYRDLYVTTAGGHIKKSDGKHAGSLFRIRPAVGGVPHFLSRIGL